jgi:hypothetical protein
LISRQNGDIRSPMMQVASKRAGAMIKATQEEKSSLPNHKVAKRYRIHRSTLSRWRNDKSMGFPKPDDRIRGRNYWREATLDAWDEARAGRDLTAEVAAARERFSKRKDDATRNQGEAE